MLNPTKIINARLSQLYCLQSRRCRSKEASSKTALTCVKPAHLFDCKPKKMDIYIGHSDKRLPQPRVIIVGAGMAGLATAVRLMDHGITNFLVLEATNRAGGRILSRWFGDVVVELGANWMIGDTAKHPVFSLASSEDPPRPGAPAALPTRFLFNRPTHGSDSNPAIFAAYQRFRQIEKETHSIYCHGFYKQHGSLVEFMSLRIQQELQGFPKEHQYTAARVMFGMAHMLAARSPDDFAWLAHDEQVGSIMCMPGGKIRVPLGLIGIIAPLLRKIPVEKILYKKGVGCIHWGTSTRKGHRAVVFCCDGEDFSADYVIVTVPFGTLMCNACTMFCPQLPFSKVEAMRRISQGHSNKIFLQYCQPFWLWLKHNIRFKFTNELLFNCDWTSGITAIDIVPSSKRVICVWVTGRQAVQMECACDRDVAEMITCLLRRLTGACDIPYPCAVLRSNWSSCPQSLCAFSNNGGDCCCNEMLATPVPCMSDPHPPILLFAGEATAPPQLSATVSGAYMSGIREADRVALLTNKYGGTPVPPADPCDEEKKEKDDDDK